MPELGVNIDHIATIREARKTWEPDPVWAASAAELGGADCITVHLREDRRHIQDRDVRLLRETVSVKLNLELACSEEILRIACELRPHQATLVPERRDEVTTEGGLDAVLHRAAVQEAVERLREAGIATSLFLDPDPRQIDVAAELRADAVELHTGTYALTQGSGRDEALRMLVAAGHQIRQSGLALHAGHGLNYHNVQPVAALEGMRELNIGHSIVSRAVFVGLGEAVREMKRLIDSAVR
ncbi:MAG: pyridoxine 5'-phosphate synthase [Pirellulaceae bacterium]|nr:pyridoxine 5'-phosphate synthase [Pirellulaceae bacterium]